MISIGQYRTTDLVIFAVILIIFDLLEYYASILFGTAAIFSFSLTVPITLLVMMRWGWYSVFYAVGDGILLSLLYNRTMWQSYLSYGVGSGALMLMLLVLKFAGKEKIASKYYWTALFVTGGWVLQNLAITALNAICGFPFVSSLSSNFGFGLTGLLSLAMAIVITLVLRKLDGMYEDQLTYLKRVKGEQEEKRRQAERGEDVLEFDEEDFAVLNKDNDLY